MAQTVERMGRLDVVVANAGVCDWETVADMSAELWDRIVGVNLHGCFNTCRAAAAQMRAAGEGGRIIVTSSVHAQMPFALMSVYGGTKQAIGHLVGVMAREWARDGITVNHIGPGWVASAINDTSPDFSTEEARLGVRRIIPLGHRAGEPEEMGEAVAYLASDDGALHDRRLHPRRRRPRDGPVLMATALFAPPDSLAPGLADALTALGRPIEELPWGGDLRSGVDVAGSDVLVTVAPLPRLGPLAEIDPAAWTAGDPRHRGAAGRGGAGAPERGRRGQALDRRHPAPQLAAEPGLGAVRRGRDPAPDGAARGRDRERGERVLRQRDRRRAARRQSRCRRPSASSGEDTPRGKPTQIGELAALVHWLAGDAPASLSGETLKLDGGFSLTRKARPAPSAEIAEWLVEKEWRDLTQVQASRSSIRR